MANISNVKATVFFKKEGKILDVPLSKEFAHLFAKASYSGSGKFIQDNDFYLLGRWTYTNNFEWKETKEYVKWLKENNYSGIYILFAEYETGCDFCQHGEIHVDVGSNKYTVNINSDSYDMEEVATKLNLSYPPDLSENVTAKDQDDYFESLSYMEDQIIDYLYSETRFSEKEYTENEEFTTSL